jgi:hypothetical protein
MMFVGPHASVGVLLPASGFPASPRPSAGAGRAAEAQLPISIVTTSDT